MPYGPRAARVFRRVRRRRRQGPPRGVPPAAQGPADRGEGEAVPGNPVPGEEPDIQALGRGLDASDAPAVRKIARDTAAQDYRWSAIVRAIVHSTPFTMSEREQTP